MFEDFHEESLSLSNCKFSTFQTKSPLNTISGLFGEVQEVFELEERLDSTETR